MKLEPWQEYGLLALGYFAAVKSFRETGNKAPALTAAVLVGGSYAGFKYYKKIENRTKADVNKNIEYYIRRGKNILEEIT